MCVPIQNLVAVSVCTPLTITAHRAQTADAVHLFLLNYLYFMFIAHHHDLPLDVASCFRLKCLDTLPETRVGICTFRGVGDGWVGWAITDFPPRF